ncbi:MAG: N-acetylneuraminate synthase [Rummeliibacillus sp.]
MSKVFIIAEAGVNHNGDLEIAKRLIDVAVSAGVDAVKFQTFKAEKLVSKEAEKAEYQIAVTGNTETQYQMLKKLELSNSMHKDLITYCKEKDILFLSTPFDLESIDYLVNIGIPIMKIPSGEITNYPYLKRIGQTGKPVILSTGMSTLEEVKKAIKVLEEYGSDDITVLHCNTEYPTPLKDVNLKAIDTLRKELNVKTGYSDHTLGIEIPIAAVAMGAIVIEKHFTLDRTMQGPDHKASLEPAELKAMVQAIRNIEMAFGTGIKEPSESEIKNITIVRKSIVACKTIVKNELFTEKNLITKRPGNGISPMMWNAVIGKRAKRDFKVNEQIEL